MGSYSSNGISPKVNAIAWLELELAYNNVTVQHISHNVTGTEGVRSVVIFVEGIDKLIDWHLFIHFNGIWTRQWLFYAYRLYDIKYSYPMLWSFDLEMGL